jgi:squalene-associated FAD-dependent desaturase
MNIVGVPESAVLRVPLELRYAQNFSLRALWLPFPLGLLGGLLLARGLPISDRLGAVRFTAALRADGFRLERDVAVAELLRTHRQDGAIGHYLWRPLCVSALNTPVEIASSRAFLVVLRDALLGGAGASDLVLPRVDLSRLFPDPAAEYVSRNGGEMRLRSPVESLEGLKKDFDRIIVAVGPHQLKTLLPGVADSYTYQPIYTCYLQYGDGVTLPFPMIGMADGLVQWVFDRGALLGEQGRLACVISAQGDHQQLSQDELAEVCHRELKKNNLVNENPLWTRVIAEKRATITCSVGRPTIETAMPGVSIAGDYTEAEYPPTLEAAVRSGVRAARMISA